MVKQSFYRLQIFSSFWDSPRVQATYHVKVLVWAKLRWNLMGTIAHFHLHVCSTSTCRSNLTPFSHSRSQCMLLWETWDTPLMWPRCTSGTVCVLFKFNSNIPLLTCWRLSIISLILVLRTMIIYLHSVRMVFGRHLCLCDQETRPTSLSWIACLWSGISNIHCHSA